MKDRSDSIASNSSSIYQHEDSIDTLKPKGPDLELGILPGNQNQTCKLDKYVMTFQNTGRQANGTAKQNRILLVDDEIFNLLAQKNILKQAEKNIVNRICKRKFGQGIMPGNGEMVSSLEKIIDTANNGKEAVEAIKLAYLRGNS